jgi:hypothetical protein
MDNAVLGEIVRQAAGERAHRIVAPVIEHIDRLDVDLKHLPGPGAFDGNGTGQDVRPELARDLGVNGGQRGRNDERRCWHQLGAARHRRDRHALATVDGEPGRQAGVEIAPMHVVGAGLKMNGH